MLRADMCVCLYAYPLIYLLWATNSCSKHFFKHANIKVAIAVEYTLSLCKKHGQKWYTK